jgi:hypothetical protein
MSRIGAAIAHALAALERFLNTRLGNALLILAWPLIVAALGLPTGVAKVALEVWLGHEVVMAPPEPSLAAEPSPPVAMVADGDSADTDAP